MLIMLLRLHEHTRPQRCCVRHMFPEAHMKEHRSFRRSFAQGLLLGLGRLHYPVRN